MDGAKREWRKDDEKKNSASNHAIAPDLEISKAEFRNHCAFLFPDSQPFSVTFCEITVNELILC